MFVLPVIDYYKIPLIEEEKLIPLTHCSLLVDHNFISSCITQKKIDVVIFVCQCWSDIPYNSCKTNLKFNSFGILWHLVSLFYSILSFYKCLKFLSFLLHTGCTVFWRFECRKTNSCMLVYQANVSIIKTLKLAPF